MKTNYFIHLCCFVGVTMLFTISCKKEPGNNFPLPYCNILNIKGSFDARPDSITFNYDAIGNPVSVIRAAPSTGFPNYQFRYDKFHRLTDYITLFPYSTEFETWHKYYYHENKIVFDSIFQFGLLGDVPRPSPIVPDLFIRGYATFEYDNVGRISKTEDSIGWGYGKLTRYYTYDTKGNLVKVLFLPGSTPGVRDSLIISNYDNKVNMHRTHPVWQFLDRMYSVNNPIKADSYNKWGLPLAFGTSSNLKNAKVLDPGGSLADFLELGTYQFIQIRYSCN